MRLSKVLVLCLSVSCASKIFCAMVDQKQKEKNKEFFFKFAELPEELQQKCFSHLVGPQKPSSARQLVAMRRVNKKFQQLLPNQYILDAVWQLIGPLKRTPMHIAAAKGDISSLRTLINLKAPVDSRDNSGGTPLHYAVKYDQLKAGALLVREEKATIHAVTKNKATPLHFAQSFIMAKFLTQAGADLNKRDNKGQTPAHYLARIRPSDEKQYTRQGRTMGYLQSQNSDAMTDKDDSGHCAAEYMREFWQPFLNRGMLMAGFQPVVLLDLDHSDLQG